MARRSAGIQIPPSLRKYARKQLWIPALFSFIENARILSKESPNINDERGGSQLILWNSQLMFLETLAEGMDSGSLFFYFLKSRQLGITTIGMFIILYFLAIEPGTLGALVADDNKNSAGFRETIRFIMKSFPSDFIGNSFKLVGDNKDYLLWTNNSRLDLLVAGKHKENWAESKGYSLAWCTEVSKYGKSLGIASFMETLSQTRGVFIFESTANGFANHWKDMWDAAGEDPYTKRRRFIGWWAKPTNAISNKDPRYAVYAKTGPNGEEAELIKQVADLYGHVVTMSQLAWYRWKQADKSTDESALDQAQPWTETQAFVLAGYNFFQVRLIQKYLDQIQQNPWPFRGYRFNLGTTIFDTTMEQITEQEDIDLVELRVWEDPVSEGQYVIGCDPAYGNSEWKDRHALQVWRCYADKMVQVAEYVDDRVETHHAAWVLAYLGGAYRNCLINLEINGPGHAILREFDTVRQMMRADLYARRVRDLDWEDFLDMARWYLYHRPDSMGPGYAIAFETSFRTKLTILNQMRDLFTTDILDIRSPPLLLEMANVTQDGDNVAPKASGKNKDDRVMATALAAKAYIDWIRGPMIQEGATYEIVTAAENGELSVTHQVMKRIVFDFWRNAEERAQAPETPTWLHDRGFI